MSVTEKQLNRMRSKIDRRLNRIARRETKLHWAMSALTAERVRLSLVADSLAGRPGVPEGDDQ